MKFFALILLSMLSLVGSLLACPQDDPPPPGGGEGGDKPAPEKPVKSAQE